MAKHHISESITLTTATCLVLLLSATKFTCSTRILDEEAPPTKTADTPQATNPVTPPAAAIAPAGPPEASQQPNGGATATASASTTNPGSNHPLTFFMHDILGGSSPSARVVTGVVANSPAVNGQLPFSRPNKDIFPMNGAQPLPNGGNTNNNNIPFMAGLGGTTSATIVQNDANIVNGATNNLPFVNAGNLPSGTTLQNLLFGTTTVIDDELTKGHELGSAVLGRAQGFYVASSEDGSSQTVVITVMFDGADHVDTLSFFGVHRTAAAESHVTIIGGTGKYENAKGYAAIQTLHPTDQHTTDGVETLLQFSVYISQ